jgi:hypothetical protein
MRCVKVRGIGAGAYTLPRTSARDSGLQVLHHVLRHVLHHKCSMTRNAPLAIPAFKGDVFTAQWLSHLCGLLLAAAPSVFRGLAIYGNPMACCLLFRSYLVLVHTGTLCVEV